MNSSGFSEADALVLELGHGSRWCRLKALVSLVEGGETSIPALHRVLEYGGPLAAVHALVALSLLGEAEAVARLGGAMGEGECVTGAPADPVLLRWWVRDLFLFAPAVRLRFVRIVRSLLGDGAADDLYRALLYGCWTIWQDLWTCNPETVEARAKRLLMQLLYDPQRTLHLRCRVAEVLGEAGDPVWVPGLCRAAAILEQPVVREAAHAALVRMGPIAVPRLLETLGGESPTWKVAGEVLIAMGKETAPALVTALPECGPYHSERIAEVLGSIAEPTALAALRPLLGSTSPVVRRSAVVAISAIGGAEAWSLLRKIVPGAPARVRAPAAVRLFREGERGPDILDALIEPVEDEDEEIQLEAARALRVLAGEAPSLALRGALPLLRKQCGRGSPVSPAVQKACAATREDIEAATAALKDLPLPARPASLAPENLPVPGGE